MPTTGTQQTRFRRTTWAAPIAGLVALSLTGACSVTGSSAQAPTSAQPAPAAQSSPAPASSTTPPSAPETTPPPAAAPVGTLPPVPPGAPADFGTGITARITDVRPITAVATAPGDIAGPATAISVSLTNGSTEAVDLNDVTVTATDATGAPASPVTGDQAQPFSGTIGPGATRNATYPFRIPPGAATGAVIVVSYRAGIPVATLTV